MKIAIYTPYLDTVGGGERYMMSIGEFLSKTHQVDVLLDSHLQGLGKDKIKEKLENLHGFDLSKVRFIRAALGDDSFFIKRVIERALFLWKYDFLIYLTDGSVFYPNAKNNILHIQSPIKNINKNLWENFKLSRYKLIIYNSKFTKEETARSWGIKGVVVYPPVPTDKIKPLKKEKIILSVGRFFGYLRDKKHELMIDAFSKLKRIKKLDGWSLHLAGAAGEGDKPYLEELKVMAKDMDVVFHPNIPFNELIKLYGKSLIYWHSAGFGESDPTKMEHFGISTVEAMAAGAIPIVINLGGQKEIIENGKSGLLWDSPDQMLELTTKVIEDEKLADKLSNNAVKRSKMFSKDNFNKKIEEIFSGNY